MGIIYFIKHAAHYATGLRRDCDANRLPVALSRRLKTGMRTLSRLSATGFGKTAENDENC